MDPQRAIVWILFLLSGACGLIYEVLWCRHLGLIFGNTVQSLSAVLTAFMGGLALGSYIGGRLSHRFQRPLMVYGILELLIGVYCAALPWFLSDHGPLVPFYRSLYGETGSSSLVVARFAVCFLLLLIPTTFMGATLPVLSQFLVRSKLGLGRTVGALYAVNTFGAVVGAAGTGFLLLPELGKTNTNWVAVACNLILGLLAIFFGREKRLAPALVSSSAEEDSRQATLSAQTAAISPGALKVAVMAFGVTGFAAMATQIGWTRAISLGTGSSTYAFSLIVSVFILGLSLGGVWGSRIASRAPDPVALLSKVLLAIGFLGMTLSLVLGFGPLLFFFLLSWGSAAPWGVLLALQTLGIGLLIIAPTFLMGATMPLTMQVASRSTDNAGRIVGTIYAVNTLGAILGSFLGGLLLLPTIHIQSTLELMALLYVVPGILLFALSASRRERKSVFTTLGILIPLTAVAIVSPSWDPRIMSSGMFLLRDAETVRAAREFRIGDAFARLNPKRDMLYYREGAAATVAVARIGDSISLSVGGKPDASSQGDMSTQLGLTMVSELLHAAGPETVLVIGLGSGVSVGAALSMESVKRVDVVEMSPEVVEGSVYFAPFNKLTYTHPEPPTWIETPRVEVLINDGRNHLLLTSRKYDVIASEPSNPWMAGVGNLFTREAFELSRGRLNPGGIMCQWVHSYSLEESNFYSITNTFSQVFKYAQLWWINRGDYLLLGSDSPITVPLERLRERIARPAVRAWLQTVNMDNEFELLACFLGNEAALRARADRGALHTDDNMLLEFSAPRALYSPSKAFRSLTFVPTPEQIVDFGAMSPRERGAFICKLDFAVAAREHLRAAQQGGVPTDEHMDLAYALAPTQHWAVLHKNNQDADRARKLLRGAPPERAEPDTQAAIQIITSAMARPAEKKWAASILDQAYSQEASKLLARGEADEALARIEKINPENQPGRTALMRAHAYTIKKEFARALDEVMKSAAQNGDPVACTAAAIKILCANGHADDALATLKQFLSAEKAKTDPLTAELWGMQSELLNGQNMAEEAIRSAQTAQRLAPGNPLFAKLLGKIYAGQGRLIDAVNAYRLRFDLDPTGEQPSLDLADALLAAVANGAAKEGSEVMLLSYARRLSHAVCSLKAENPAGWERLCRALLALAKFDRANAASMGWGAHAARAYAKALEACKGDASKLPADLVSQFAEPTKN